MRVSNKYCTYFCNPSCAFFSSSARPGLVLGAVIGGRHDQITILFIHWATSFIPSIIDPNVFRMSPAFTVTAVNRFSWMLFVGDEICVMQSSGQ